MEAGAAAAEGLLGSMDVPYYVAAPLLLQDMASWRLWRHGTTVGRAHALPELAVLLTPWCWVRSKATTSYWSKSVLRSRQRVQGAPLGTRPLATARGLVLYGFPPNVGAVGPAALLNVPRSLDAILHTLQTRATTRRRASRARSSRAAWLCRPDVINGGAARMVTSLEAAARRAKAGDPNVAEALREFIDEADTFRGDVTVIADARSGDDIGDTLTTVHKSNCRDASPPRLTD